MKPDYYAILGVQPDATHETIKQAFRALAREKHPDKGGDTVTFQSIQEAYETLSDTSKRQAYDASRTMPPNIDITTLFQNVFGVSTHSSNVGQSKCKDCVVECSLTLEEVFFGCVKRIVIHKETLCSACNVVCTTCQGQGYTQQFVRMGFVSHMGFIPCQTCKTLGQVFRHASECTQCVDGRCQEQKLVDLQIEPGIETGMQFVVEGWGGQPTRSNQIPGDVIVTTIVQPHSVFERKGLDLVYKCSIPLTKSITGMVLAVPCFDGMLHIQTRDFGILNPHKLYTIHGRGLQKSGQRGDLGICFEIVYPECVLTTTQAEQVHQAFCLAQLE